MALRSTGGGNPSPVPPSQTGGMALTEMSLEEKLHDLRRKIDSNIKYASSLKGREDYQKCIREMSLAYTKLQEAKMWVGKCLEAIGAPFPKELRDEAE